MSGDEAAEELRLIEEERVRRLSEERYRYYEPNGVQSRFLDAFGSGDYFILFLSAANGVGKTAMAANLVANLMFPSDNPYFQTPLFRQFPFLKRGRIVTDSSLVEKNALNELRFWFPKGRYRADKAGKTYESSWSTDTGWTFDVMTYDQDPKQFEGVTLGFAWFDEPPPDAILKATIARMRRGGVIVITATPISGSAHLFDTFASGELETEVVVREGEAPVKVKRRVFHLTADVESACKTHGTRGHLEHEHIVQMVAEYPEDEREARIHGRFQHLVGLVFKRFSRPIHVVRPFDVNPRDYSVVQFLDPHPRNPDAVLWVATDRKGRRFVVDELFLKCSGGVEELAQRIKQKDSLYRVVWRGIDPSAFIEDQHTQKSLASRLADHGLVYQEASKARAASDRRIEDALAYQRLDGTGEFIREPELFVFETCQRTIWEMEHYRWQEWVGKAADSHGRREQPVDKDDHMVENLGRALIQDRPFEPMPVPLPPTPVSFDPYAGPSGGVGSDDPY